MLYKTYRTFLYCKVILYCNIMRWFNRLECIYNYPKLFPIYCLSVYFLFIKSTKVSNTTLNFSAGSSNDKRYKVSHIQSIIYILVASSLQKNQWVRWVIFGRGKVDNKYSLHIIFWTVPSVKPSTDFHVSHDVYFNVIGCNFYLNVELTFPQTSLNAVWGSWLKSCR